MKKINFRYLFYPFLSLLLGINVARKLFAGNTEYILIISLLAVGILIFSLLKKYYKQLIVIFLCFLVGNGLYFVGIREFNAVAFDGKVSVVGRISDNYKDNGYSHTILLEDVKINGKTGKNIYLSLKNCENIVDVGSFIAFESELQEIKPFTLDRFNSTAYRNGVRYYASADYENVVINEGYKTFDERVRLTVRDLLYKNMSEKNAGTAYAVLFGDKNNLDDGVYDAYSGAGIIHVLTVSGLHVGFLITLVYGFLKLCRLNKYLNFAFTTIFIFFYAYLCGFSPSVLRAGIMSIIYMFSKLCYRRYDGLSAVGLAGFVLCLSRPLFALDVGFQMSVFCVMSIFVLMPVLTKCFEKAVPNKIASLLSVSISAQVGILPMLCLIGGSLNVLSIFANLIIVPIFSLLYPVLFVVSMAGAVFPFLGKLLILIDYCFSAIFVIAKFFASTPTQITLKEMDFAKILIFYVILFVLSDYFMVFPKERSLIFACLILCYSLVFGFYLIDNGKLSPINYISQYNNASVILKNSQGHTLVVGDCNLIERFSNYADEKVDIFVETQKLSQKRYDVYEKMGISHFITNYNFSYSEASYIECGEEYMIGGYLITYLEKGENVTGVKVSFDEKNIFIATGESLSYNDVKELTENYNLDFIFSENYYQNITALQVSMSNKNSDYNYQKFGNMSFDVANRQYSVRRLD